MSDIPRDIAATWRTTHGDLTDEEWALIADLVLPRPSPSKMGRPRHVDRRAVVNAIFYVAATGCQWRALPATYPNWNTVHRLHLQWSRDGTWERIADRLRELVREGEGRDPEPSAGVIDARSVRGAATVTGKTRGYDAGKKFSGRKAFGLVDTGGLLVGVAMSPPRCPTTSGGSAWSTSCATRSSGSVSCGVTAGSSGRSSSTAGTITSPPASSPSFIRTGSNRCRDAGLLSGPGHG